MTPSINTPLINLIVPYAINTIARLPGYAFCSSGHILSQWENIGKGYGYGSEAILSNMWHLLTEQDNEGYKQVTLAHKQYSVHRLILEAFVGPCPPTLEACHGDNDRSNNAITNLRWDTRKANTEDRLRAGTSIKGEKHPKATLTNAQIDGIRILWNTFLPDGKRKYSQLSLARLYNVTQATISRILNNKRRNK